MSRAEYLREWRKKKKESEKVTCILKVFLDDDKEFAIYFKPMSISKALEVKSLLDEESNYPVDILLS